MHNNFQLARKYNTQEYLSRNKDILISKQFSKNEETVGFKEKHNVRRNIFLVNVLFFFPLLFKNVSFGGQGEGGGGKGRWKGIFKRLNFSHSDFVGF